VRQELGQVDVNDRSQHDDVLVLVGILELQVARSGEHRLDGPHAVVVVMLRAQLLRAQAIRGHDLNGQRSRINETVRVQGDLGDHGVVGHHHGHRAEERLQVVGQLGAARVAGIHCDEGGAGGIEADLGAFEHDHVSAAVDTSLNGQDLLGHHGQHLQIDAVELVEARPGAAGRQALEELAQGNVVEAVRAVEHDTLLGHGFRQVFGGLGLACAGGTFRRATQVKVKRTEERSVASVCEWSDHQATRVTCLKKLEN
jgi:hypothetical protein